VDTHAGRLDQGSTSDTAGLSLDEEYYKEYQIYEEYYKEYYEERRNISADFFQQQANWVDYQTMAQADAAPAAITAESVVHQEPGDLPYDLDWSYFQYLFNAEYKIVDREASSVELLEDYPVYQSDYSLLVSGEDMVGGNKGRNTPLGRKFLPQK